MIMVSKKKLSAALVLCRALCAHMSLFTSVPTARVYAKAPSTSVKICSLRGWASQVSSGSGSGGGGASDATIALWSLRVARRCARTKSALPRAASPPTKSLQRRVGQPQVFSENNSFRSGNRTTVRTFGDLRTYVELPGLGRFFAALGFGRVISSTTQVFSAFGRSTHTHTQRMALYTA